VGDAYGINGWHAMRCIELMQQHSMVRPARLARGLHAKYWEALRKGMLMSLVYAVKYGQVEKPAAIVIAVPDILLACTRLQHTTRYPVFARPSATMMSVDKLTAAYR